MLDLSLLSIDNKIVCTICDVHRLLINIASEGGDERHQAPHPNAIQNVNITNQTHAETLILQNVH
jgi:hypothetical protein